LVFTPTTSKKNSQGQYRPRQDFLILLLTGNMGWGITFTYHPPVIGDIPVFTERNTITS
jgi:hypothetical protein